MFVKKIIPMLIILTLFAGLPTVLLSQNSNFEGRVKVNGVHEGNESEVDYFLKGEKLRMEVEQPQKMVVISDEENILVLMPQQNMYMEFPKDQAELMQQMMGSEQKSDSEDLFDKDMTLRNTGETKNILGRACVQWVYQDEDKKVETWVTSGLKNFMGFTTPLQGGKEDNWAGLFGDPNLFPMEFTQWDKYGNESHKFKVTEMEEKSLSDDLFTAPANYEKMNIMGMPRR